jgi:hypothetical protein
MVLFFQVGAFGLGLLKLITTPHALEMLPGQHEPKKKNQYP